MHMDTIPPTHTHWLHTSMQTLYVMNANMPPRDIAATPMMLQLPIVLIANAVRTEVSLAITNSHEKYIPLYDVDVFHRLPLLFEATTVQYD